MASAMKSDKTQCLESSEAGGPKKLTSYGFSLLDAIHASERGPRAKQVAGEEGRKEEVEVEGDDGARCSSRWVAAGVGAYG